MSIITNIVDLNKKPDMTPPTTALAMVALVAIPEPEQTADPPKEDINVGFLPGFIELDPKKRKPMSATAYFVFKDALLFKKLLDQIRVLTDEATFHIDAESLWIRSMDPSRVAMLDYRLEKRIFEEFHVSDPGKFCVNLEELIKVVFSKNSGIKKDTDIKVKIDGVRDKITFTVQTGRERQRTLLLLEPSDEEIPVPKIAFNTMTKIVADDWEKDLEDMEKVSDHVTLVQTYDSLMVEARGDMASGKNTYERGSDIMLDIVTHQTSKATFGLSYFKGLSSASLCDVETLEFSTDMPIKITLQTPFGDLFNYLAPRIETE